MLASPVVIAVLKYWKLAGLGLLCLLLAVQSTRLSHRGNQLERAKIDLNEARAELKRLADESEARQRETARRIAEAEKQRQVVERIVTKLETRPLPDACQTPDVTEWEKLL